MENSKQKVNQSDQREEEKALALMALSGAFQRALERQLLSDCALSSIQDKPTAIPPIGICSPNPLLRNQEALISSSSIQAMIPVHRAIAIR